MLLEPRLLFRGGLVNLIIFVGIQKQVTLLHYKHKEGGKNKEKGKG